MKMNNITRYTILLGIMIGMILSSCSKIEEGFLSDTIRYRDSVIYCKRGMTLTLSDRINADGSTPPFEFKMLNLRNKMTGEPAPDEFTKMYEIEVFKEGMTFNAATDTTVALLKAKRETKKVTPMEFNPISGQISFNRASANLPLGVYTFDLQATNRKGTKIYKSFAEIHVIEPFLEDVFELTYAAMTGSNASETFTPAYNSNIKLTCTKVSDEGARVILKVVDKNGRAWDPSAGQVIKRGDRPTFESHVRFNPVVATNTALLCDYEVAPFPLTKFNDGKTNWEYNIYYRIPMRFAAMDGHPNHNINPVFGFRVLMEGTFEVEVKLTNVAAINSSGPPTTGL